MSLVPLAAQDVRSLVVTTAGNAGRDALGLTWGWLGDSFDALFAKLGGARGLAAVVLRVRVLCAPCAGSTGAWVWAGSCGRRLPSSAPSNQRSPIGHGSRLLLLLRLPCLTGMAACRHPCARCPAALCAAGDAEAAKSLASIVERVGSLFSQPQQAADVDRMMARFKASLF